MLFCCPNMCRHVYYCEFNFYNIKWTCRLATRSFHEMSVGTANQLIVSSHGYMYELSPCMDNLSFQCYTPYFLMCVLLQFGLNHSHTCSLLCRVSSSMSLNAAVFGAVCLSSLLPSPLHVFALMFTVVAMFAVLPNARTVLKVGISIHMHTVGQPLVTYSIMYDIKPALH